MKGNSNEGKSSNGSVYRLLQSPAPICMFYFAHPFGIATPASGAKLAQMRDRATKGTEETAAPTETNCAAPDGAAKTGDQSHRHRKQSNNRAGQRKERELPRKQSHRKMNGGMPAEELRPKRDDAEHRQKKAKKHRTPHRRISNFEKFLLEIQHPHGGHTCGAGSSNRGGRIDAGEDRITPLVPWPSIIWNRDFLIPTLLQALAQQYGRKIPDIEQILRTVRSAWNTPKSQRSHLQSRDSRESSASNWDLSSLCDSYCCYLDFRRRMGAGTYANATSPGPGLLRRRYSVPEIIMRKHTLAQQKTEDESLWLQHDTNHNVIEVVVNKQAVQGGLPGTPPHHRKSVGLRQPAEDRERLANGRSSSVESGAGGAREWQRMGGGGGGGGGGRTLTTTGSDPNLASLKHRGACGSPLCNGLGGIGASRAMAATAGTGGSFRSIHNNSLSCSSSSSLNGPSAVAGGSSSSSSSGGGCGHQHQQQQQQHQQQQQQQVLVLGGSNGPIVPAFIRDGDYSMRKTTLLRRMWSRELRRYERSGSWSPPLRRAPRRIYSIESIASAEGHHHLHHQHRPHQQQQSPSREDEDGGSRPSSSGSSVGSGGRCATTATTTTTTGATSCLECAKLERQYTGGFGTGRKLLSRTAVGSVECVNGRENGPDPETASGIDPTAATVDDRRQRGRSRQQQRMCSSQSADLGESVSARIVPGSLESPLTELVAGQADNIEEDEDVDGQDQELDLDLDPDSEYLSHSSSVSSIASQSYRVSSSAARRNERSASRANDNDLSDLSEFLQQEQLAARDGSVVPPEVPLANGVEDGREAAGQAAPVRAGSAAAGDHPRERAPVAGDSSAAAAAAVEGPPGPAVEPQFPLRSATRQRRPSEDSSVALSALSEDSQDSTSEPSDCEDGTADGVNGGPERRDSQDRARLDEYISNLLLDNLNNLADAKELVLATDAQGGDAGTLLGVYSERRAQLDEGTTAIVAADRLNNNNNNNNSAPERDASTPSGAMKQKLTGKYIGGGGGVVCNSPPQVDKRKLSPSVEQGAGDGGQGEGETVECDKENEDEDVVNNNDIGGRDNGKHGQEKPERNHRRQKPGTILVENQPEPEQPRKHAAGRAKAANANGFYLAREHERAGSRSPRHAEEPLTAEIDLNGKYYFPSYGLETDPSDNTDIASEPEPLQLLGKIGTGSTYPESAVVPRFSAVPRTESMEVQPSSTNSDECEDRRRRQSRAPADSDDSSGDSDGSLVDSLDGFSSPRPRTRSHRHGKAEPVQQPPGPDPTTTTAGSSSTAADRSPRHEKGEAFFVPIHAEAAEAFRIDERVVVADTMPLKIKERLNNRRRLMNWKKEQENLKKQRKLMRTIEQRRFYGEPAIQVISTIDRAISRKEYIPPAAKKAVFGGRAGTVNAAVPIAGGAPPFRAMKPKKRASAGGAGAALRSELGMLESYKIDGKGNMQIQTPSSGPTGTGGGAGGGVAAAAGGARLKSQPSKAGWGVTAERRHTGKAGRETPATSGGMTMTASTTVGSTRSSGGRTASSRGQDPVRRKQVLKDVQQMTLYPQADLTPDIEGGPRRMYQKTEIQEGDKHIEILEIVECADSAPRGRHGGRGSVGRAHSGGRSRSSNQRQNHQSHHRSRIPVPIYRFGHYRRSGGSSREGSPLSAGVSSKVDRMIADLLLEALVSNPEEANVKFVKTPEVLRDGGKTASKKAPAGGSSKGTKSSGTSQAASGTGSSTGNLLTPRRTASGKYTQKFEVIPEERSSVSIESSTEELSSSGRKKPHPSPRRVSFDENHQILNGDELDDVPSTKSSPVRLIVPTPKPQPSPKHRSQPPQQVPVSPRKAPLASPAKSPTRQAATKKQGTITATTTTTNTTTTTTSRGKAAIQSDVIEEKGWIGFSTQHEDMATPVANGQDDEDASIIVPCGALARTEPQSSRSERDTTTTTTSRPPPHVTRVKTITTGNCLPVVIHGHRRPPAAEPLPADCGRLVPYGSEQQPWSDGGIPCGTDPSPCGHCDPPPSGVVENHRDFSCSSYAAPCGQGVSSNSNPLSGDGIALDGDHGDDPDPSDAESFVTDSLNTKPTPPSVHHCCRVTHNDGNEQQHQLATPLTTTTVVENRQTVRSCHHSGHSLNELTVPAGPDAVKEIREENAWHVYQTADCKVIQSKIEYYETSIHRTPQAAGGGGGHAQHQHFHASATGPSADLFGALVEHRRAPTLEDGTFQLCPHHGPPLSTADSLDSHLSPSSTLLLNSALARHRAATSSAEPPKTSETTCSSCCFCNPDLHRRPANSKPSDGCFYCHAKSPGKSFPAPPTPPNIQTPSSIPASPQVSEVAELTPTPSLQEIKLPVKRQPATIPKVGAKENHRNPPPPASDGTGKTKPSEVSDSRTLEVLRKGDAGGQNKSGTNNKKQSETTSTKTAAGSRQGPEKVLKRTSSSYPAPATGGSTTTTTTNATTAPSIPPSAEDGGPPTNPKVVASQSTPTLNRKKLGVQAGAGTGSVLNRPKHINHLSRTSAVVHSVQKEIKNELRTPIRVLPKTAKEVSNRKEKERQISLNLPLGAAPSSQPVGMRKELLRQPSSLGGLLGYERSNKAAMQQQVYPPPLTQPAPPGQLGNQMASHTAIVTAMTIEDHAEGSETRCYDEETSSDSSSSSEPGSLDSSPNSSPFKGRTVGKNGIAVHNGVPPEERGQEQQRLPPTAATRWKTNSERNLSQLAIQKVVSASKWGSKWRKSSTRDATDDQQQQQQPTQQQQQSHVLEDEFEARDRVPRQGRLLSAGSCSDLSPLKGGSHRNGDLLGNGGSLADRTASSNIISGISQTASNQGWTVTVAGNYNPEMAPDVEMRLSFPKGSTGSTGGKSQSMTTGTSSSAITQQDSLAGGRQRHQPQQYLEGGRAPNYAVLDHLDGSVGYTGGSRNSSRAATLPPPGGLNPKRNLTRSDGAGGGTSTSKDYRLPNVGPTHNILARPTAKKAIKTVECSVVASATRTIANNYHQLSHQHQASSHGSQQHHLSSRGPGPVTGRAHQRSRAAVNLPSQAQTHQVLHPALQNGSGGKFLSSSSPSLVSQHPQQQQQHPLHHHHHLQQQQQQQPMHPSQRFPPPHPESSYHLEDYGHNAYYDHHRQQQQQQPPHQHQPRRMSLDSQPHPHAPPPMTDCLSIMGNAIAPELKPKVPTMSEKDLTRRHHVCYTRTQPYFS